MVALLILVFVTETLLSLYISVAPLLLTYRIIFAVYIFFFLLVAVIFAFKIL